MTRHIDIDLEGLRQLYSRVERQNLASDDWPIIDALVTNLISREDAKVARILQKIAAEKAAETAAQQDSGNEVIDAEFSSIDTDAAIGSDSNTGETDDKVEKSTGADKPSDNDGKKSGKGHGRNGASAFTGAQHTFHSFLTTLLGTICEKCKKGYNMRKYREKTIIRVTGQPLFSAVVHHFEQLRCKICGHIIRAPSPASVYEGIGSSYIVYSWSACAMLIVMHYFSGMPFKRLESLQAGWGIPMPDANQWDIVNQGADFLLPLFKALERHGVELAKNLRIDDTGSMIIEIQKQIRSEIKALQEAGKSTRDVRTGINATGVYLETDAGKVILFYTGRHHAGEIIDQLLKNRRKNSPKLPKATDGASKNFDHKSADKLIESVCNAHAFLKFHDVKDHFPAEYAVAGRVYNQIFDNDDFTKENGMTDVERMGYHAKYSKPLMEELKEMCEDKINSRLVEPRSDLWDPVTFIINQWPRLTKFYKVPGVPLDTNLCEQTLIIPVRYLAASFNYKNTTGSEVGDRHMSLVVSARANGVEPVGYLTHCLANHEDLAKRPEYYLPWAYRERFNGEPPNPFKIE